MGLINKIFGASNKIKVQFIDNNKDQTIGVSKMTANQLPETFSVQTTMHIQGGDWIVEEAIPENSVDFVKTKNLVLKMRKIEKINPSDLRYSLPTISNEFPQTTATIEQTDYDIQIHEDDYRQNEFLNLSSQHLVEKEFLGIKDIWENHSKKSDEITLFKNCHSRNTIGKPNLTIDFEELKSLLKCNSVGQVLINGNALKNGFALKTENTTFFGVQNIDKVTELCISQWNEKTKDEILEINKAFNLLFVNWSHCDLIKND
ncbi:MAG: hypothetical protein PVH88_17550 [Ignavibacteria bacterium]|jgi:hypothetical protein